MKKSTMCFLCFFFSLLFAIAHAVPLRDSGVVVNSKEIKSEAAINVFDMTLTPVDQTCVGNGQVVIDITNTEAGAEFEIQIYQLPNISVPIRVTSGITATGSTLSHTEGSLPTGDFMFRVAQVVGVESNEQSANVTVGSNLQTLAFGLSQGQSCGGADITVSVTSGHPQTYELRDTSNNVVIAPQSANVLSSVLPGDYIVIVTDECGDSESLGVTVVASNQDYTSSNNNGSHGFFSMGDCDTIYHIEQLRYGGSPSIPDYKYPIQVEIEIENPTGGANTLINTTWNSTADNSMEVNVPFYEYETYTYTATFTDACGDVYVRTVDINATPSVRSRFLIAECGTKYLRLDLFRYHYSPTEITFTSYPAGFDPAHYNSAFVAGAYTHTYNTVPSAVNFGNPSSIGLPEGDYTIEITTCGRTETKNVTVTNTGAYSIHVSRYYSGCGDNEGSINFYIRSNVGSQQADDLTTVNVTAAPTDFVTNYGALPYDVSYNIATNGVFYMNSLPAGDYTIQATGSCGAPLTRTFTIYDKDVTSTVTPTFNCGSFNVEASISSYLGNEIMWFQKYYPASGQWGHPTTGALYTEGNQIGTVTGIQMNTTSNHSGYQTFSGAINNIVESGQFRVIVQSTIHNNGQSGLLYCHEVLDTFNVPENGGVVLNNYYVANCISGNTELIIDANGVAPLNYTITEFNGTPVTIDNGTDPVFSELAAGEYTVEIEDGCGETRVFQFKTDVVKQPVIVPDNLCVGETATLFVNGLNFLTIEWTKDNDPTVIGTGNSLQLDLFDPTVDSGTYHATLTYDPNPNACLSQTLSYEITAPPGLPEAGTGQTVNIAQSDAGIMNLFDYVTAPYDNWGEWTDLSNTGYLNNEVWDASSLPVGQYQFEYLVDGDCLGTDSTIVTVNIIASGLNGVQDDVADVCPFIAHTNIINVMDNDNVSGTPVVQSDFTISEETPDTEGIISVNSDGTVDVAAGAQPGQTYTLDYRITENANTNNFAIGTLTVTILVDDEDPTFVGALPANVTVECDAIPDAAVLTATDNCGTADVTYSQVKTDGLCTGDYTLTRTWTAEDLSGNTTVHVQTITVQDTTPPYMDLPEGLEELSDEDLPSITIECDEVDNIITLQEAIDEVEAEMYDECGQVIVTATEVTTEGICPSNYTIVREFTAVDECGNSAGVVYTQTITVQDTTAPTFDTTPPTDAIEVACTEDIPAAATITATDSCGDATVYVDELRTDGACFGQYTIERRWVAIDACGNQTVSDPQIITVNDVTGPTFNENLPADITLECTDTIPDEAVLTATDCTLDIDNDADENFKLDGSLLLNIQEAMNGYDTNNNDAYGVVGTYNVNDYLYTYASGTQSPAIPNPLPEYNGVTFTITTTNLAIGSEPNRVSPNGFGSGVNIQNAKVEITFSSDVFFTINGKPNMRAQERLDFLGDGTTLVPYPNGVGTHSDPNLVSSVTGPFYLYNPSPFDPNNKNLNRVDYTRSIYGGIGTQLIIEHRHPVNIGTSNAPMFHLELFPQQDLVTFDEEIVEGSCANNYEIVRTWTATDDCGNETVHTQTITVQDTTAPTFTVPTDVVLECDQDVNDLSLTGDVTDESDNCSTGLEVTYSDVVAAGNCANEYTITRTWILVDACGNISEQDQTITVQDTTAPVATGVVYSGVTGVNACMADAETAAPFDAAMAVQGYTDNCASEVTATLTGTQVLGDNCAWEVTYTYSVADACGNILPNQSYTNYGGDQTAPTRTGTAYAGVTGVNACMADATTAAPFDAAMAIQGHEDNCGGEVTATLTNTVVSGDDCAWDVTYTYTIADACGNTSADTYTYTNSGSNQNAPVLAGTAYAGVTGVNACMADAETAAPFDAAMAIQGYTDNCGGSIVTATLDNSEVSGDDCNWTITYTYTIEDACGNTTTGSYSNSGSNQNVPTVTVNPQHASTECGSDTAMDDYYAWIASNGGGEAQDSCGNDVTWTHWLEDTNTIVGLSGTVTVNFKATDNCGNYVIRQATFAFVDTTAPEITQEPTDLVIECSLNGEDELNAWLSNFGGAQATDDCGQVTWSHNYQSSLSVCGDPIVVTFTATDEAGLQTTTTAEVSVVDTVAPVLTVAAQPLTVQCGDNTAQALNNWLANHGGAEAIDSCATVTWSNDYDPANFVFACGETGSVSVTFTGSDSCGNFVETVAVFTIEDTVGPTILTPAQPQTAECGAASEAALQAWLANNAGASATDSCDSDLTWSNDYDVANMTTACGNTGEVLVTFTATDDCGNSSHTVAKFTIVDTTNPVFDTAPENAEAECGADAEDAYQAWLANNAGAEASDNCGEVTYSYELVDTVVLCGNTNERVVLFTATDACGNTVSNQASFSIIDTTAPEIVTQAADLTVECDGNGNLSDLAGWLQNLGGAEATDGCSTVTWSNNFKGLVDDCGSTGSAEVTFTATDACGNINTATATFTIEDTTDPVFVGNLPQDRTIECSDPTPEVETISAEDLCGSASVSFSEEHIDGDCPNNYTLVRTWTATDACGNTAEHVQEITVQDTTAPEFVGDLPEKEIFVRCEDLMDAEDLTAIDNCGEVSIVTYDEIIPDECGSTKYDIIRRWVATDECGNESVYTQTIHMSCKIEVFNAVTPNGDGYNDELVLEGIACYPGNSVEIYNRWGVLVYETTDYDSNGNTFKGYSTGRSTISQDGMLPSGTYYYIIKYNYDLGNGEVYPIEQAGYLHLETNK